MGQRELLKYLIKHKKGTTIEIAEGLGIARSRIPELVCKLEVKAGIEIERHIDKKTGRITYELIEW